MESNVRGFLIIIRAEEEVKNIASKGGQASHSGGFASMDPDKQVCDPTVTAVLLRRVLTYVLIARYCLQGWPGFLWIFRTRQ
jgi:hypothetical protein